MNTVGGSENSLYVQVVNIIGKVQWWLGVCLNVPLSVCVFYYLDNEDDFIFLFHLQEIGVGKYLY